MAKGNLVMKAYTINRITQARLGMHMAVPHVRVMLRAAEENNRAAMVVIYPHCCRPLRPAIAQGCLQTINGAWMIEGCCRGCVVTVARRTRDRIDVPGEPEKENQKL